MSVCYVYEGCVITLIEILVMFVQLNYNVLSMIKADV